MSSVPWISFCLSPGSLWDAEFSASQPLHHVDTFISRRHVRSLGCFAYSIWFIIWAALKPAWLLPADCSLISAPVTSYQRLSSLHCPENATCWMMLVAHHLHFLTGHAVPSHPGLPLCFLLIPRHGGVDLTKPRQGLHTDQTLSPSQALSLILCSFVSSLFLSPRLNMPYGEATPVMTHPNRE